MKYMTRSIGIIVIMVLLLTACKQQEAIYVPGTYINEAEGYYSTLKVSVTVSEYDIESIEVLSHEEPEILADVVFEKLPPRIKKKNSTDVDIVSGATYTSKALLEAVSVALDQARVVK